MDPFPFKAYLAAKERQNKGNDDYQQIADVISQIGKTGSQLIQAKKQAQQKKQWGSSIDQLVQQNPTLAPYGSAMKMDTSMLEKIAPVMLKQKQMQQAEAVPFDQAVQIAGTAGNQTAAAPFIQTAQAQGRDYLTKQEMSDMFKTITTGASQGRGEYFRGMLDVNKSRLGLQQRQAAFGGQFGKNQLSLNTALGHVQTASDAFDAVQNTNQQYLNVPINKLKNMTNDPNVVRLGISLNALQGELANVFKGSGATDQEISQWQKYLNENLTPAQYGAAIPQIGELLDSRLGALSYQQQQVAPGVVDPSKTLTPKAKGVIGGLRSKEGLQRKIFNSPEEAEAANLPKGTRITINGRAAVIE